MILQPGAFRTRKYRKAIPDWVKIVCAIRALAVGVVYDPQSSQMIAWIRSLRFDHRPPLQDRPLDTETNDFVPPQNDPEYIEAIPSKDHDARTFGRKSDAEKTVTTLNSDSHNRTHGKRIRDREALHELKMEVKRGDPEAIAKLLQVERRPKPKAKIRSRGFMKKPKADKLPLPERIRCGTNKVRC